MKRDHTVEELMEHFHKTRATVMGWLRTGMIPGAYKAGRTWLVPAEGLDQLKRDSAISPLTSRKTAS